jgi:Protein of unknown function (DUF3224)
LIHLPVHRYNPEMNKRFCAVAGALASLAMASSSFTNRQFQISGTTQKGASVSTHAAGTFEVKITPQTSGDNEDASLGRMTIDKQFHGDLEGASKGQMLTAGTSVKGSAGYVAIEKVSGTLNGRNGTFILQHSATMTRGAPQLSITVVPDSGTGQLVGLSGKMTINISEGQHSYAFEYALPETP